jgi:molecular chaperone DnaK (HSP70)
MAKIIGIDLGTTSSAVAVAEAGKSNREEWSGQAERGVVVAEYIDVDEQDGKGKSAA